MDLDFNGHQTNMCIMDNMYNLKRQGWELLRQKIRLSLDIGKKVKGLKMVI